MRERCYGVFGLSGLRHSFFGLCVVASVALAAEDAASAETGEAVAAATVSVTRLVYREIEDGIEAFDNQYLFTDRYLRISDPDDASGYILFDANERKIYSVSHFDRSILVIPEYSLKAISKDYRDDISYEKLADAPLIDGLPVYNYRASASPLAGGEAQVCADIQLVPDLLPAAAETMRLYMQVMSSQQQMNLEKTPPEMRTPCLLQDQVFNTGEYYRRGLPVREWHSNGKLRLLLDFSRVEVNSSLFALPPDYRWFSIDESSD